MNTELTELEYTVRTLVTDRPWIIYFNANAEVSGSMDEPTIELIEYSSVRFLPKNVSEHEDYETYMCEFKNFDTLYQLFRKDDLDKVKCKVETLAIEDYFSGYLDYQYEFYKGD